MTDKMEAMRKIRQDLFETMRQIEQKGHDSLINGEWKDILATKPSPPSTEQTQQTIQEDNKRHDAPLIGPNSLESMKPILSNGTSRIQIVPSSTSSQISINIKDPNEVKTVVAALSSISEVCRTFDSVLSNALPLAGTDSSKEKSPTIAAKSAKEIDKFFEFLHNEDNVPTAAEMSEDTMRTWLSWLPPTFSEHMSGSLLRSKESLTTLLTKSETSDFTGKTFACDCGLCRCVNSYTKSSEVTIYGIPSLHSALDAGTTSSPYAGNALNITSNTSSPGSKNGPEQESPPSLASERSSGRSYLADSEDSIKRLIIAKAGKSSTSTHNWPTVESKGSGQHCCGGGSLIKTIPRSFEKLDHWDSFAYRIPELNADNYDQQDPPTFERKRPTSYTDCSPRATVSKKPKVDEDKLPTVESQKSTATICQCTWCASDPTLRGPAPKCFLQSLRSHSTVISKRSNQSGYEADKETSSSRISDTCDSAATLDSLERASMLRFSHSTPQPRAQQQNSSVDALTLDERRLLDHKKNIWLLFLIICNTGIRVADEALKGLDANC